MMDGAATHKAARRWLAIVEGVLFLWFLMLGYQGTHLLERVVICSQNHGPLKGVELPQVTSLMRFLLPESALGIFGSAVCASIGFAYIAGSSREGMASRWFRWTFIAVSTALFFMAFPVIELRTCLCGVPDTSWSDEVLIVSIGVAVMVLGRRYAKQHS